MLSVRDALFCVVAGLGILRLARQRNSGPPQHNPRELARYPLRNVPPPAAENDVEAVLSTNFPFFASLCLKLMGVMGWALLLTREFGSVLGLRVTVLLVSLAVCVTVVIWCLIENKLAEKDIQKDVQERGIDVGGLIRQTERVDFSGTWVKDGRASTSMDEAVAVMHLNGLIKMAICLVRGLEIKQSGEMFDLAVFSVIKWFKVIESYPCDGGVREYRRRDLRRGRHRGGIQWMPDGSMALNLEWDEPYGGSGTDLFKLVNGNELHVVSTICREGREVGYTTVYRRKV